MLFSREWAQNVEWFSEVVEQGKIPTLPKLAMCERGGSLLNHSSPRPFSANKSHRYDESRMEDGSGRACYAEIRFLELLVPPVESSSW